MDNENRDMGNLTMSMFTNIIKLLINTNSLEMLYRAIGKGSGHNHMQALTSRCTMR